MSMPRVRSGDKMVMATLNIQGMKEVMKREEVEEWMVRRGVDVLALQETHIPETKVEVRNKFTWYFSGKAPPGEKAIVEGVALVIKNDWRNYIADVQPVNERIALLKLWGTPRVVLVSAYGPTARASVEEKNRFWSQLKRTVKLEDKRGLVVVLGDFNPGCRRHCREKRIILDRTPLTAPT